MTLGIICMAKTDIINLHVSFEVKEYLQDPKKQQIPRMNTRPVTTSEPGQPKVGTQRVYLAEPHLSSILGRIRIDILGKYLRFEGS
jgi:hypothetical protein